MKSFHPKNPKYTLSKIYPHLKFIKPQKSPDPKFTLILEIFYPKNLSKIYPLFILLYKFHDPVFTLT